MIIRNNKRANEIDYYSTLAMFENYVEVSTISVVLYQ